MRWKIVFCIAFCFIFISPYIYTSVLSTTFQTQNIKNEIKPKAQNGIIDLANWD